MSTTGVENKSLVLRAASAVGGFFGRVAHKCLGAVAYVGSKIARAFSWAIYYTERIPVVGRFIANIPISAGAMVVATVFHAAVYTFAYGVAGMGTLLLGAGSSMLLFVAIGTLQIAAALTVVQLLVNAFTWVLFYNQMKEVELET